ncbi:hypothetical protein BH09ACT6_BH09ACT6_01020 [soil metagenome]
MGQPPNALSGEMVKFVKVRYCTSVAVATIPVPMVEASHIGVRFETICSGCSSSFRKYRACYPAGLMACGADMIQSLPRTAPRRRASGLCCHKRAFWEGCDECCRTARPQSAQNSRRRCRIRQPEAARTALGVTRQAVSSCIRAKVLQMGAEPVRRPMTAIWSKSSPRPDLERFRLDLHCALQRYTSCSAQSPTGFQFVLARITICRDSRSQRQGTGPPRRVGACHRQSPRGNLCRRGRKFRQVGYRQGLNRRLGQCGPAGGFALVRTRQRDFL